jgi:hypothetical protein
MLNTKALRQLATYGVSLPTLAASPAVAKATVYMPSHLAARLFEQQLAATVWSDDRAIAPECGEESVVERPAL